MEIYWIWLSRLKHVGPVWQKQLLAQFQTPKAVYESIEDELLQIPKLTKSARKSILSNRCLKDAENILETAESRRVNLLTLTSEYYPKFAQESKQSPILLYYKGELQPLHTTVGVVGARRCSPYGRKIAKQIGEELAAINTPVVSGFAKGIDSYAQAACSKKGGYTIAFFGCGPDICYPREHRILYQQILENGGVFLSQYPPGTLPSPKYFLARNALISAWSQELVIVEAGERSGALWTVDFAIKNNKPVYAVPNRIDSQEGAGTNRLLAQGIPPYLGIQSLQAYKENQEHSNPSLAAIIPKSPILQLLSNSPATIHQLSRELNLDVTDIMDQLFELELDKQIIVRGNMVYRV
ncbi:DNA-processing protein DprA [Cytobacillus massiliigabonensis]|uniref:DNA-processing protein DprA n=1 Tax=Cytobacillus massiliigabonensis TaxID=1871011 RepID=UPI0015E12A5C|nr:DNA-processing protein DprA [Cytobacillus massiliigabonensis]